MKGYSAALAIRSCTISSCHAEVRPSAWYQVFVLVGKNEETLAFGRVTRLVGVYWPYAMQHAGLLARPCCTMISDLSNPPSGLGGQHINNARKASVRAECASKTNAFTICIGRGSHCTSLPVPIPNPVPNPGPSSCCISLPLPLPLILALALTLTIVTVNHPNPKPRTRDALASPCPYLSPEPQPTRTLTLTPNLTEP